jgi:hypothetical protein
MKLRDIVTESDESKSVTINIPITITIPASGTPKVDTVAAPAGKDLPESPVYVSPLQQELELKKQQGGKQSKVINQILSDDGADSKISESGDYFDLNEDYAELQRRFDCLTETDQLPPG